MRTVEPYKRDKVHLQGIANVIKTPPLEQRKKCIKHKSGSGQVYIRPGACLTIHRSGTHPHCTPAAAKCTFAQAKEQLAQRKRRWRIWGIHRREADWVLADLRRFCAKKFTNRVAGKLGARPYIRALPTKQVSNRVNLPRNVAVCCGQASSPGSASAHTSCCIV